MRPKYFAWFFLFAAAVMIMIGMFASCNTPIAIGRNDFVAGYQGDEWQAPPPGLTPADWEFLAAGQRELQEMRSLAKHKR